MKNRASDWYILTVSDLIDIYRHHKEYLIQKCDWVCPKDEICDLHTKNYVILMITQNGKGTETLPIKMK